MLQAKELTQSSTTSATMLGLTMLGLEFMLR